MNPSRLRGRYLRILKFFIGVIGRFIWCWAFGVVASTLLTKQHVFIDVLGGALVGFGCYIVCWRGGRQAHGRAGRLCAISVGDGGSVGSCGLRRAAAARPAGCRDPRGAMALCRQPAECFAAYRFCILS